MTDTSMPVKDSSKHRRHAFLSLAMLVMVLFLLTKWYDLANQMTLVSLASSPAPPNTKSDLYRAAEHSGGFGIVLGLVLSLFVWHPRRVLGLLPWASLVLAGCFFLLPYQNGLVVTAFFTGMSAGLMAWPLMITLLRQIGLTGPLPAQGLGWFSVLAVAGLVGAYSLRIVLTKLPMQHVYHGLTAAAVVLTISCWFFLAQHALEVVLELLFMPMYRFTFLGPGVQQIPPDGPLIVIANHSCMLDPFFLGKIVPRKIIPIMTAKYYDLPVIRWFMKHMVGTIRVPVSSRKTEAPELDEAIARLDQGQCLVIFPEGKLRREENVELQYFSQGIWRILKERPNTPIVAAWIDGAWGSFLSYRHGPPGRGKGLDWFRPIRIVVHSPITLPTDILATHQATRRYLTDLVGSLRHHLVTEPNLVASEPQTVQQPEKVESE